MSLSCAYFDVVIDMLVEWGQRETGPKSDNQLWEQARRVQHLQASRRLTEEFADRSSQFGRRQAMPSIAGQRPLQIRALEHEQTLQKHTTSRPEVPSNRYAALQAKLGNCVICDVSRRKQFTSIETAAASDPTLIGHGYHPIVNTLT